LMARLTGVTTQQQRQQRVQMRALSRQALAKSPDLVAHRLAIEKAAEDAKGKTDVKKGLSIPEFATRDLLLPSVKEILDSSKLLDHLPESKVVDLWDSRAVIRAGNDKFNDRIGASFGEGHRIDLSLIDLDDLEARTCFTQKRILKLFVIYTKVCHGEGDATIDSHQFRLFLKDEPRFRVPKDSTVVQHMFEVFDNDRNGSLTFQELVNGLSFFTQDSQHDESAPRFEDPGFPTLCVQFFDLSRAGEVSLLNLLQVCQCFEAKGIAFEISECVFEFISETNSNVTYHEFKELLISDPCLREMLYSAMQLVGASKESPMFTTYYSRLLELCDFEGWQRCKAQGLIPVFDRLLARPVGQWASIRSRAATIYQSRKASHEGVCAAFYVQTVNAVISKGWSHVLKEKEDVKRALAPVETALQHNSEAHEKVNAFQQQRLTILNAMIESHNKCVGTSYLG